MAGQMEGWLDYDEQRLSCYKWTFQELVNNFKPELEGRTKRTFKSLLLASLKTNWQEKRTTCGIHFLLKVKALDVNNREEFIHFLITGNWCKKEISSLHIKSHELNKSFEDQLEFPVHTRSSGAVITKFEIHAVDSSLEEFNFYEDGQFKFKTKPAGEGKDFESIRMLDKLKPYIVADLGLELSKIRRFSAETISDPDINYKFKLEFVTEAGNREIVCLDVPRPPDDGQQHRPVLFESVKTDNNKRAMTEIRQQSLRPAQRSPCPLTSLHAAGPKSDPQQLVESIRTTLEQETGLHFNSLEAVSFKTHAMDKRNYFVKALGLARGGKQHFVHLRIYKHSPGAVVLTAYQMNRKAADKIDYFE